MAKDQPQHFAHTQRFAHRSRDVGERFRLTSLALTLGVETRVAQRARGLRAHGEQQVGIVVGECVTSSARDGDHCHQVATHPQRNGEQ